MKEWADINNTCPICRKQFNQIIKTLANGKKRTIKIVNKKQRADQDIEPIAMIDLEQFFLVDIDYDAEYEEDSSWEEEYLDLPNNRFIDLTCDPISIDLTLSPVHQPQSPINELHINNSSERKRKRDSQDESSNPLPLEVETPILQENNNTQIIFINLDEEKEEEEGKGGNQTN